MYVWLLITGLIVELHYKLLLSVNELFFLNVFILLVIFIHALMKRDDIKVESRMK